MDSITMAPILLGATLLFIALAPFIGKRAVGRMMNGSTAKQAQGKRLMASGSKGQATVLSITPTGTIINRVNIECNITFRVQPLDVSDSFDGEKTAFIPQTALPRVGDIWPCWFDAADASLFVVARPDLSAPEAQAILQDFGIANPLTSEAPSAVAAGSETEAIAHLSTLRAQGILDDAQFEDAAKQLLNR